MRRIISFTTRTYRFEKEYSFTQNAKGKKR